MTSLIATAIILLHLQISTIDTNHKRLSFLGYEIPEEPSSSIPINPQNNHRQLVDNDDYSVSLSISPSNLTTPHGFQIINLSWEWEITNHSIPSNQDWIGLYSPATSSNDDYLDRFSPGEELQGSYQTLIWNMRDDYQVRYISDYYGIEMVAGISNIAKVNPYQPLQGHISLTKNSPHEMQIRWVCMIHICQSHHHPNLLLKFFCFEL